MILKNDNGKINEQNQFTNFFECNKFLVGRMGVVFPFQARPGVITYERLFLGGFLILDINADPINRVARYL